MGPQKVEDAVLRIAIFNLRSSIFSLIQPVLLQLIFVELNAEPRLG
jgi:hypothetical protein